MTESGCRPPSPSYTSLMSNEDFDIQEWIPTHEITVEQTCHPFSRYQEYVMLVEELHGKGGPAYSTEEWMAGSTADWECDENGEWHCSGQPTPGGRTDLTVTVRRPEYLEQEAEKIRETYKEEWVDEDLDKHGALKALREAVTLLQSTVEGEPDSDYESGLRDGVKGAVAYLNELIVKWESAD
jgi:hypothetical protein